MSPNQSTCSLLSEFLLFLELGTWMGPHIKRGTEASQKSPWLPPLLPACAWQGGIFSHSQPQRPEATTYLSWVMPLSLVSAWMKSFALRLLRKGSEKARGYSEWYFSNARLQKTASFLLSNSLLVCPPMYSEIQDLFIFPFCLLAGSHTALSVARSAHAALVLLLFQSLKRMLLWFCCHSPSESVELGPEEACTKLHRPWDIWALSEELQKLWNCTQEGPEWVSLLPRLDSNWEVCVAVLDWRPESPLWLFWETSHSYCRVQESVDVIDLGFHMCLCIADYLLCSSSRCPNFFLVLIHLFSNLSRILLVAKWDSPPFSRFSCDIPFSSSSQRIPPIHTPCLLPRCLE